MKKPFSLLIFLSIVLLTLSDCARRGRPEGGPKDEDAPIMATAKPPYLSTNFKEKEIRIYFNEYIKLKNLQDQLVVSPPLKYPPIITPVGTPSKFIKIKILDTLKENTTYTFNFGQSVTDNTEGNILNNFKYVFSTGDIIDSLKVSGTIKDAFKKEADENISIMLYEISENFTDSVVYKEKPLYVANTLDTTFWEITNIKAGNYLLIALKDASRDYLFHPKNDKIGFLEKAIEVPGDTSYLLNLFKEELPFSVTRPAEMSKGHIFIGYEGNADSLKVSPIDEPETFVSRSYFEKDKDTLNFWFKGNSKDSLVLLAQNNDLLDTLVVKLRTKKSDSLQLNTTTRGYLHLRNKFKINSNIPLQLLDTSKIYFIDGDSAKVNYNYNLSKTQSDIVFDFEKKYSQRYHMQLLPEAITDLYGNVNDSIKYAFNIMKPSDYGNLYLTLQNVKDYPIIVQLISEKGELIEEIYATEEREYSFLNLEPARYLVRIIFDENKNKKWDTGNFLLKIQPEKVIYSPDLYDIRANWDPRETLILN